MKAVALLLMLIAVPAHALYKCTAAGGSVTYQQAACPNTQTQQLLFARPAAPAEGTTAPATPAPARQKSSREDPPATAVKAEPLPRGMGESLTRLEAKFGRLSALRVDLEATRKLASR